MARAHRKGLLRVSALATATILAVPGGGSEGPVRAAAAASSENPASPDGPVTPGAANRSRRDAERWLERAVGLREDGAHVEAKEAALRAAAGFEDAGDASGQSRALLLAAELAARAGLSDETLSLHARAVALAESSGEQEMLRRSLERGGRQAAISGRLRVAVEWLGRAARLSDNSGDLLLAASARVNLGYALQAAGRFDEALEAYSAGSRIYGEAVGNGPKKASAERGELIARVNAATVKYAWLGRTDEAIEDIHTALERARRLGDAGVEANCRLNLAEAHASSGALDAALEQAEAARRGYERLGLPGWQAAAEVTLAKIFIEKRSWEGAFAAASRAAGFAESSGERNTLRLALQRQGQALEALGRPGEALERYRRAVGIVEVLRREAESEELQVSFFRTRLDAYEYLIGLLSRLHAAEPDAGHAAEALTASEAARCRTFLDHLPSPPGVTVSPLEPLAADAIRDRLAPGTLLLEYLVGDERVTLFAVSRDRLELIDLGSAVDLSDRSDYLASLLSAGEPDASLGEEPVWKTVARRLRRELLDPGLAVLPNASSLIIVPDGMLHGLPFEALLQEDASGSGRSEGPGVSYVPSASFLATFDRSRPSDRPVRDFIGVGVEQADTPGEQAVPLPLAAVEIRMAGRFFKGERADLLSPAPTETAVREVLAAPASVLHFATHARLDGEDPGGSALLLSGGTASSHSTLATLATRATRATSAQAGWNASDASGIAKMEEMEEMGEMGKNDGQLTAREIARMHLPADLAVLSACETGRGEIAPREGVLGLARAFLRAGTRSLLVTLWKVPDATAVRMTTLFYEEAAAGRSLDRALANARARLGAGRQGLAFVLVGDGSIRLDGIMEPPGTGRGQVAAALFAMASLCALFALGVRWRDRKR